MTRNCCTYIYVCICILWNNFLYVFALEKLFILFSRRPSILLESMVGHFIGTIIIRIKNKLNPGNFRLTTCIYIIYQILKQCLMLKVFMHLYVYIDIYIYILIYTVECSIRFNKIWLGSCVLNYFLFIGRRNKNRYYCEWEKKQRLIRWQWKHSNTNVFRDFLLLLVNFFFF